ncbi:hypothetical protein NLJ89_g5593 [Agrocybe chaxingu]|uniref:G domain-containing protein n=1 Tax=Agrocybe chaxingu TaxID=84603 RepID=A0A9W8MVG1_9AGAR|nr:hypothetical protein NLJ89_g5593 [Agrocybe chaxingu]
MMMKNTPPTGEAVIALMGPTGTGKSTFINLLTNDENIRIGHDLESQTFDVSTSRYVDREAGLAVTFVDTPGFDDSRDGVTDTDILRKIADFLQAEWVLFVFVLLDIDIKRYRGGRKLNGIIYLHRISDPRMGGMAKKNLRMFKELCGDNSLVNVLIVTTNWNLVDEKEGSARQAALAQGAFKPFVDSGVRLFRHDKGLESTRLIISELMDQEPVALKIQEELDAGRSLGETSAGAVIIEELQELQKKHEEEMESLRKEIEDAARANDEELRLELAEERRKLEETMARAVEDRKVLEMKRITQPVAESSMGVEFATFSKMTELEDTVRTSSAESFALVDGGHSEERHRRRAGSGSPVREFLHELADIGGDLSKAGGERLGKAGVIGAIAALWLLVPLLAAKKVMAGH